MVKMNRTTEYGLMALTYIRGKSSGELASAREISEFYKLPFEILAKTLQRLKEQGVISSTYGTRGGYILSRDLKALNLLEFLNIMEGHTGLVPCVTTSNPVTLTSKKESDACCCEYEGSCSIKPTLNLLNGKIYGFLRQITLDELTDPKSLHQEVQVS